MLYGLLDKPLGRGLRYDPDTKIPDLNGKIIVVTGGMSNILSANIKLTILQAMLVSERKPSFVSPSTIQNEYTFSHETKTYPRLRSRIYSQSSPTRRYLSYNATSRI